jgi:hypothetical protein
MFDPVFEDGTLQSYIQNNLEDPWRNTPFEGYVYISPKQKGEFGERFVSKLMMLLGHEVEKATNSTAGHDRIINRIPTEIKFSLANRDKKGEIAQDQFIINHVSVGKDWERLIFCGINPEEKDARIVYITKEDFEAHLRDDKCYFSVQQGGKKVGNDDYICTNVAALLRCSFIKDISKW